ncbi:MAG TPA: PadR family transcriptional regulator [Vicinamibacterales bacterium]|nr:PadR family transcriptional regulator [Vicinamibacterales bacterium]
MSPRKRADRPGDLVQGTLDMLVLQTLILGPAHGYAIAEIIQKRSDAVLQVEQGSLYPALHRLEDKGLIASFWDTTENNRRARYYRLTAAGQRQLHRETSRWAALVAAVARVMDPAER